MFDVAKRIRFERLVLPHFDAAFALARWLTRDAVQAEEAVQEAILRAFRYFHAFRGDVALWEVVRIASWKSIPDSTIIIREGDQGESFYLLLEGEVGVTLLGKPLSTIKHSGRQTVYRSTQEIIPPGE